MFQKFAVVLFAVAVSAGSAHARISGLSSLSHAHFPTCADGLVSKTCVCRASNALHRQQLCRPGRYCHTFDGLCRD